MVTSIGNAQGSASEGRDSPDSGKGSGLPKINGFERFTRLISLPISSAIAYLTFHPMSRQGMKDFLSIHKYLKNEEEQRWNQVEAAKSNPDPKAIFKNLGTIDREWEEGITKRLCQEGFESNIFKGKTSTLKMFARNSGEAQLNILMTTGAALSIAMGAFAIIADPRNRAAIYGLFRKVDNQTKQKDEAVRQA